MNLNGFYTNKNIPTGNKIVARSFAALRQVLAEAGMIVIVVD